MADIYHGRYVLAEPDSGITVFSMDGEINFFGACTVINTTKTDSYSRIEDDPKEVDEPEEEKHTLKTVIYGGIGTVVSAVLGACAITIMGVATALTGGAAVAAFALAGVTAGASAGTFVATAGMVQNDLNTGYDRSTAEFSVSLLSGGMTGAEAGAAVAGVMVATPAVAAMGGTMLGTSALTTSASSAIITSGGVVLAGSKSFVALSDAYECGSGYNVILNVGFDNDRESYETAEMAIDALCEGYVWMGENFKVSAAVIGKEWDIENIRKADITVDNGSDVGISERNNAGDLEVDIKEKGGKQNTYGTGTAGGNELQIELEAYEFGNDEGVHIEQINQSVDVDFEKVIKSASEDFRGVNRKQVTRFKNMEAGIQKLGEKFEDLHKLLIILLCNILKIF